MKIKYDNTSIIEFLKKIDSQEGNFLRPYNSQNTIDTLRIDKKCTFFHDMPFNAPQYVFIENDSITISTSYNVHKKSVSNNIITRKDFFKAFTKLEISKILDESVFKEFSPEEYDLIDHYDYTEHLSPFVSYTAGLQGNSSGYSELVWNEDLDTFTMEYM